MAACNNHQPAKHISLYPTGKSYDPSPKDKQKPTTAWDFKRDGIKESYISPPKKRITGYEDKETCTSNESECPPCDKEEVCAAKDHPDGGSKGKCTVKCSEPCEKETCTTESVPVYE